MFSIPVVCGKKFLVAANSSWEAAEIYCLLNILWYAWSLGTEHHPQKILMLMSWGWGLGLVGLDWLSWSLEPPRSLSVTHAHLYMFLPCRIILAAYDVILHTQCRPDRWCYLPCFGAEWDPHQAWPPALRLSSLQNLSPNQLPFLLKTILS